jgi:hypothetical protein
MYWRPLHEADLLKCLELQLDCIGDEIAGRTEAVRVWKSLLDHPSFLATVIESETAVHGEKIVGCGMGIFVSETFADREIVNPGPGLNSRIIAAVANDEPVLLSPAQIAAGNAGNGLDFVTMYGTWRDGVLSSAELAEVQRLLGSSFVEHYAGYRFHRILKEAIGPSMIALARATGTYRLIAEFPERKSALALLTPQDAVAAPYSVAAALYRYRPPVLHLRPSEQKFLMSALSGKTDAELSDETELSVETIKKRWLSIFARIDEFRPEILGDPGAEREGRGPQKRHRVLAYIRSHPEELRPFSWDAKKQPWR